MQKAKNIKEIYPLIEIVPWENINDAVEDMDIIINTTSLGMINGNDFEKTFNTMGLSTMILFLPQT